MDVNVLALREDGVWGMIKVGGVWGGVDGLWEDGWGCYAYYRLQYFILSISGSCTYVCEKLCNERCSYPQFIHTWMLNKWVDCRIGRSFGAE